MGEDLRPLYKDAFREGYRAGQLAMRERAAIAAEHAGETIYSKRGNTSVTTIRLDRADIAKAIRALEPEEPK